MTRKAQFFTLKVKLQNLLDITYNFSLGYNVLTLLISMDFKMLKIISAPNFWLISKQSYL